MSYKNDPREITPSLTVSVRKQATPSRRGKPLSITPPISQCIVWKANRHRNIMNDYQRSLWWTSFNWELYHKYLRIKNLNP